MNNPMIDELHKRAVSLEEFSYHIKRVSRFPEELFEEYCARKGDPDVQHSYLNAVCDTIFYGKDHINENAIGITAGPKKRIKGQKFIDKYKRLNDEYRALVNSGDIRTLSTECDLNLNMMADLAYCRNHYRVACRNALRKGIQIFQENLALAGLNNKQLKAPRCEDCNCEMDWQQGQGMFIRKAWVCSNCGNFKTVGLLIETLMSPRPARKNVYQEKYQREGRGLPLSFPSTQQHVLL